MSTRDELAEALGGGQIYYEPQRTLHYMKADALIAEGWRKMPSDFTVERVERGGDFQSITFSNGSTICGSSEQDADGNWIDSRAIDAILALMDGGSA